MAVDEARAAVLRTRITEVESAIHGLMSGTPIVRVTRGDRTIEYARGSLRDLQSYLATLNAELRVAEGRPGRAIGVYF